MDSKIVKADRKAVTEAVMVAASKVAKSYMKKYYDHLDELVKDLAESEFECERRAVVKSLRGLDGSEILEDLFSNGQDHCAHMQLRFSSIIDAALRTERPKDPKGPTVAVKDIKWEDLTDDGKRLLVDDLSKSYAENAAELFGKRFQEQADNYPGDTLSEINETVVEGCNADTHLDGVDIDEDHSFVLKHLKPKRKAVGALTGASEKSARA